MDKVYCAVADGECDAVTSFSANGTSAPLWMQKSTASRAVRSLNDNQQTSLSAMIVYISHRSGQSEFRVERKLADHFNIPNAKCLHANDFDEAIRYLADIASSVKV